MYWVTVKQTGMQKISTVRSRANTRGRLGEFGANLGVGVCPELYGVNRVCVCVCVCVFVSTTVLSNVCKPLSLI